MNAMTVLHCEVACDTPQGVRLCALKLAAGATVSEALREARGQLGGEAIDWDGARCGIWGRVCARSAALSDGDRIELYRELPQDPRQRRRANVQRERRR
jgi:putative ubiquitin-RnfH superfamily antitoxin RatB of RatAB toxin-antitoxin module